MTPQTSSSKKLSLNTVHQQKVINTYLVNVKLNSLKETGLCASYDLNCRQEPVQKLNQVSAMLLAIPAHHLKLLTNF